MTVSRSNLGTVPFYSTAPTNPSVKIANDQFVNLSEQQKLDLHRDQDSFQRNFKNRSLQASNSKLPFGLALTGIAGLSLMIFGHGVIGLCSASAAALYVLYHLSSDA